MSRWLLMIIAVMLVAACGDETTRPEGDSNVVPAGPIDPYADPPDYSGDPFAEFPGFTGMSIPGEQEVVEEYEEEILSGTHFTVQISAATTQETADRLAESVSGEVVHPVFVDQEGGYWKVRVGAFPARADAEDYVQVLVNMGFTDAWVTAREP